MTLFQTFVDASEANWARYEIEKFDRSNCYTVLDRELDKIMKTGTRAQCERWLAEQAARKGFEAIRDAVKEDPLMSTDIIWWIANFLDTLAAEPETTSGWVTCPECGQENCSDKLCKVKP